VSLPVLLSVSAQCHVVRQTFLHCPEPGEVLALALASCLHLLPLLRLETGNQCFIQCILHIATTK